MRRNCALESLTAGRRRSVIALKALFEYSRHNNAIRILTDPLTERCEGFGSGRPPSVGEHRLEAQSTRQIRYRKVALNEANAPRQVMLIYPGAPAVVVYSEGSCTETW